MRLRASALTSATGIPKTCEATVTWRSSPLAKAAISAWSPERCAMIRSSIWE
jgi:hypothetical protein